MKEGKKVHEDSYLEFKKEAIPATFEEMLKESKTLPIISQEFKILNLNYGIYGSIDEVILTPSEFVIVDKKRKPPAYDSSINQVYGYCLAFKDLIKKIDQRPIIGALREKDTDNVYWSSPFNKAAEKNIISNIKHIQGLISGDEKFTSCKNRYKCSPCRFNMDCRRVFYKRNRRYY